MMKKLHMVAFGAALLLLISNMAFAAPATTMSKQDAATRARMTLAMKSVDGQLYDVYAISDNEYLMGDSYQWRQYNTYEENWKGNFYLYIANQSDANAMQQRVNLFDEHYKSESNASKFIVNTTYPNYNGFYIVQGKAGMPDVLIHTIRESGGGFFSIRA